MRRALLPICAVALLCLVVFSPAASANRSCGYVSPRSAFPDVVGLAVSDAGCQKARSVASSIQRSWRKHPSAALPDRAAGFACRYSLKHEPTRDPYYHAVCRRGTAIAQMDLTS